mgnify:CR=1 FL=1
MKNVTGILIVNYFKFTPPPFAKGIDAENVCTFPEAFFGEIDDDAAGGSEGF